MGFDMGVELGYYLIEHWSVNGKGHEMAARKAVQEELTRQMILDAAGDLFVKNGYQHVSMREIARVLEYSHGAIYYHFKNKAELFYALVEEHFRLLDSLLEDCMKQDIDPKEKLKQILVGYIRFGLTYQSHYEIMFLIKDENVRYFINEGPSKSYEKFANSVDSLCEKKLSIQEIWSLFLSLHGFVEHYLGHVTSYDDVKDLVNAHANFLLRIID